MSITDDIRDAIAPKIIICHDAATGSLPVALSCVICKKEYYISDKLYLCVPGEGPVCHSCGERFAPEMLKTMLEYREKDLHELITGKKQKENDLSSDEWADIEKHIDALLVILEDLSKGVARGIIEAPAGHIGLLYLAKDFVKPQRKENETDKDYELRVKSYRIQMLQQKIRNETIERVLTLQKYFKKLGLPL